MGVVEDDIVEARRDKATMLLRSIDLFRSRGLIGKKLLEREELQIPRWHRMEGKILCSLIRRSFSDIDRQAA